MTFIFMIQWYLTLQLLSIAGLPIAFAWLHKLPSRGYAAAKAIGLLMTGVLLWWGSIIHLWDNHTAAAFSAAGVLFLAGLWAMRGHWHAVGAWWKANRTFIITTEALFVGAFLLWSFVRATQPQIETAGGEKWMEIAFLNAILRSPTMPPHDPWLSGFAISYYYLGYLLLGMVTRIAAVPPTIAFNLGNAAWFALAAIGAYGIVYDMAEGRHVHAPLLAPLILLLTGNAEGFLEVLHARGWLPATFWSWLDIRSINTPPSPPYSWIPTRFFWWWQASRTLHDYTPWGADQEIIDEFPAFSFILGDMHPHLLALPFVLLAIALALNLWKKGLSAPAGPKKEKSLTSATIFPLTQWVRRLRPWVGYAWILGALGFLNTWDFPIYWGLIVGTAVLAQMVQYAREPADYENNTPGQETPTSPVLKALRQIVPEAIILGFLSVGLYFPFWIGLRSQAGGILPNIVNATRLPQFIVMFAPLLVPITGLIVKVAQKAQVNWRDIIKWGLLTMGTAILMGLVTGAVVGSPYIAALVKGEPLEGLNLDTQMVVRALLLRLLNPWTAFLLIIGCVTLIWVLLKPSTLERLNTLTFPALLTLLGLGLTLVPEFFFLKDIFMTRMNTIFKFYFQAWVLWSLASAWWITHTMENRSYVTTSEQAALSTKRLRAKNLGIVVACSLIAVGLLYTALAIPARAQEHGTELNTLSDFNQLTLDGIAWLQARYPGDWQAIQWINQMIPGRPIILEAPGNNHKAYVYEGRVSALTGLPTVLGWAGHEAQWRGNYEEQSQREQDLEVLFTTTDLDLTEILLHKYNIDYIYIGPTERSRYPANGLEKFEVSFSAVYSNEDVTIYQVRNP